MREGDAWETPGFAVRVVSRYPDGAWHGIEVEMRGVPGVARVEAGEIAELARNHRFRLDIPRDYPHDLDLAIRVETPLYHPRISAESGKACYQAAGELDRVLLDLLGSVLMRPDAVRPPDRFPGADWGFDPDRMEWYIEAGPDAVHEELLARWHDETGGREADTPVRTNPIRFLE